MSNRAIFFDRDDTLIEDPGYINNPSQVKLLPGVTDALIELKKMGYLLVVVTNQSAVARGIVTEEGLEKIHQRLIKLLTLEGAAIDHIYYCPCHPNGVIAEYRTESDLRKPNPGMLLMAAEDMDIDLEQSWMLGNSYRDIAAGIRAGTRTVLIESATKPATKKPSDPVPFKKATNMREAVNIIKMYDQRHRAVQQNQQARNQQFTAHSPKQVSEATRQNQRYAPPTPPPATPPSAAAAIVEDIKLKDAAKQHSDAAVRMVRTFHSKIETAEEPSMEQDQPTGTEKTHRLLEEMARHLKTVYRENMFSEFSIMKAIAGVIQIVVLFCLLLSVWLLIDRTADSTQVHTTLAYAAVLQLMVIAFYMMRDRK